MRIPNASVQPHDPPHGRTSLWGGCGLRPERFGIGEKIQGCLLMWLHSGSALPQDGKGESPQKVSSRMRLAPNVENILRDDVQPPALRESNGRLAPSRTW